MYSVPGSNGLKPDMVAVKPDWSAFIVDVHIVCGGTDMEQPWRAKKGKHDRNDFCGHQCPGIGEWHLKIFGSNLVMARSVVWENYHRVTQAGHLCGSTYPVASPPAYMQVIYFF